MAKKTENWMTGLKAYSVPLALGAISLGMVFASSNQQDDIDALDAHISELEAQAKEIGAADAKLDGTFDKEEHKEVIKGRTVSAEKIGKAMIAVDDELTAFYKTNEPFPEDQAEKDALMKGLEEAQIENARLTGANESDHINTWKLNPEWKTTLETVVTYQDAPQVPVLFSMKTKDGESAGLIYATYDTENDRLANIIKHYTTAGLADAVDVGGI